MRKTSVSVLLCAAVLSACDENAVQDITGPLPSARIKFFNFGVEAPGVNFYAGDTKMTAISSTTGTESTLGTDYGAAAGGGRYSAIAPGEYTFAGRIAAESDKDVAISAATATIADGQSYSFYQSGVYDPETKTVDAFIVEDAFNAEPEYFVAYVRFVNAIANSDPMTLYATSTSTGDEIAIGDAVAYQEAGDFIALPGGVYDLGTRHTGSADDAISRTEVSFFVGRIYSVGARGDITAESDAAPGWPFLDNTANR